MVLKKKKLLTLDLHCLDSMQTAVLHLSHPGEAHEIMVSRTLPCRRDSSLINVITIDCNRKARETQKEDICVKEFLGLAGRNC